MFLPSTSLMIWETGCVYLLLLFTHSYIQFFCMDFHFWSRWFKFHLTLMHQVTNTLQETCKTMPLKTQDIRHWGTATLESSKTRAQPYLCPFTTWRKSPGRNVREGKLGRSSSVFQSWRDRWESRKMQVARVQSSTSLKNGQRIIPSSFYEASLTIIPRPNKGVTRQGYYRPSL